MKEAEIKGEVHLSRKDYRELLEFNLDSFDAIFLEDNNGKVFQRKITLPYLLFLIGNIFYGATFGRIYVSKEKLKNRAKELDVPVYDMDTNPTEMYELVSWKRRIFLSGLGLLCGLLLLVIVVLIIQGLGVYIGIPIFSTYIAAFVLLGSGTLFLGFGVFLLIAGDTVRKRDDFMANSILEEVEDDYNRILVNCGDDHLDGVSDHLEEEEWDVNLHPSKSILVLPSRIKDQIMRGLFHPKKTIMEQTRV